MILFYFYWQLFSAGLPQQGEDEEGFDGFMINDIVKEYHRASRIVSTLKSNITLTSVNKRKDWP